MIEQIGAFAGLAAFLGLAVLALLSFTQGRDIRRLREWAGSAPERDAERKEATSTIAAQRAEELRAAGGIPDRRARGGQQARGTPPAARGRAAGTRAAANASARAPPDFGARLAEPRYLIAIFVVMLVVVGGVAYMLLSGSDDSAGGKKAASRRRPRCQPSEIDVTVLNGTATAGLAATYGDKVEGKGFKLGAVSNTDQSFDSQRRHVRTRPRAGSAQGRQAAGDLEGRADELGSRSPPRRGRTSRSWSARTMPRRRVRPRRPGLRASRPRHGCRLRLGAAAQARPAGPRPGHLRRRAGAAPGEPGPQLHPQRRLPLRPDPDPFRVTQSDDATVQVVKPGGRVVVTLARDELPQALPLLHLLLGRPPARRRHRAARPLQAAGEAARAGTQPGPARRDQAAPGAARSTRTPARPSARGRRLERLPRRPPGVLVAAGACAAAILLPPAARARWRCCWRSASSRS